jgi:hypothetical protein
MSVERDGYGGPVVFRCDGHRCHEFEETRCAEWSGAMAKIKAHGWRVRLNARGEWLHYCPDCEVPR